MAWLWGVAIGYVVCAVRMYVSERNDGLLVGCTGFFRVFADLLCYVVASPCASFLTTKEDGANSIVDG